MVGRFPSLVAGLMLVLAIAPAAYGGQIITRSSDAADSRSSVRIIQKAGDGVIIIRPSRDRPRKIASGGTHGLEQADRYRESPLGRDHRRFDRDLRRFEHDFDRFDRLDRFDRGHRRDRFDVYPRHDFDVRRRDRFEDRFDVYPKHEFDLDRRKFRFDDRRDRHDRLHRRLRDRHERFHDRGDWHDERFKLHREHRLDDGGIRLYLRFGDED
ncbi:MAG: hypothetical protein ACOCTI_01560 [Phycisphaeraceae bacterium]